MIGGEDNKLSRELLPPLFLFLLFLLLSQLSAFGLKVQTIKLLSGSPKSGETLLINYEIHVACDLSATYKTKNGG